jgi:hypothetical protein
LEVSPCQPRQFLLLIFDILKRKIQKFKISTHYLSKIERSKTHQIAVLPHQISLGEKDGLESRKDSGFKAL